MIYFGGPSDTFLLQIHIQMDIYYKQNGVKHCGIMSPVLLFDKARRSGICAPSPFVTHVHHPSLSHTFTAPFCHTRFFNVISQKAVRVMKQCCHVCRTSIEIAEIPEEVRKLLFYKHIKELQLLLCSSLFKFKQHNYYKLIITSNHTHTHTGYKMWCCRIPHVLGLFVNGNMVGVT